MAIVPLEAAHLAPLYALYKRTVADVPHCRFLPSAELFHTRVLERQRSGTRMFVSVDGDQVQGFAALVDRGTAADGVVEAAVSMLLFSREQAGDMLLDVCRQAASASGTRRLHAFPQSHGRCPIPGYNAGWDGLSDRMAAVGRVLVRAGFAPVYRELHMACHFDRFPPLLTPQPAGITVAERVSDQNERTSVAMVDGREMGMCVYMTLDTALDDPAAARWGYIAGLEVNEQLRRRGVARHLLTHAMARLHEAGCAGCWLTTGAENWPAQPLYLSLGFEVVDTSACFAQTLQAG